MLKAPSEFIVIFIIISVLLILALVVFISMIIYRYQQKQNAYYKELKSLKTSHENALLQAHLEIQEQTFQNISREIHDNIGQKLTLAKLHLNTFDFENKNKACLQIQDTVDIIGHVITDLSNLSHSMSSEIILNNGIIKALEYEEDQLKKSGLYNTCFSITGNPVYLNNNTELVLFRIVQEVLNNIVKHASATAIQMHLHYNAANLSVEIKDNGRGFNFTEKTAGTGLQNIKKRTALLNGIFNIYSNEHSGTEVKIKIPLYDNTTDV